MYAYMCFCTSCEQRHCLPLSGYSSFQVVVNSLENRDGAILCSRGKFHLLSSIVTFERNLYYIFGLLDPFSLRIVQFSSQKPFNNRLIFKNMFFPKTSFRWVEKRLLFNIEIYCNSLGKVT